MQIEKLKHRKTNIKHRLVRTIAASVMALVSCLAVAQAASPEGPILFTNVNVFDGVSDKLIKNANVVVTGNRITAVSTEELSVAGGRVIDGGGRTLMPGLIDAHVHLQIVMSIDKLMRVPLDYVAARTLEEAEATLMRGFTTVRDASGAVFGVKQAIDEERYPGPRIYAAGAALGMSGGHYDFRENSNVPRLLGGPNWTAIEYTGGAINVDGVDEVLAASRLQFRRGASYLKMAVSGSIEGVYDPLEISEFSYDEIKAAVDEARRWKTFLAVHTYNDEATQRALEAGAMTIEHACLITEETVKLLVKKGAFLSTQTGVFLEEPPSYWDDNMKAKQLKTQQGLDNLMKLAKKHNAKIALGTDLVGSPEIMEAQAFELTNRLKWFTPIEILRQATVNNAELLSLTGPMNPYPGKLGVIEEDAYADILLVNGNPLEDLTLFNNPEENLALIMKDGKIYKNTVN